MGVSPIERHRAYLFPDCLPEAAMVACRMRPGLACVLLSSCHWSRTLLVLPAHPLVYHSCIRAASSQSEKQRTYWQYLRRKVLKPPTPPYSHVCQVGDPVLRCTAAPVEPSQVTSHEVQVLIQTLVRVMRREECVGLSAPQVGVPLQVFVAEFPERMWQKNVPNVREAKQMTPFPLRVFVNPTMRVLDSRLVSFPEGCSSISGFSACVPRYQAVHLSGEQRGAVEK
ncbi:peptide deformylase, mitochondrial [Tiliqua scincoides]|uniref:peptide deformylase, mitochondrial n=1 Tax=Tiliqua scincoides TaxID=71010 RepID=UPI003461C683